MAQQEKRDVVVSINNGQALSSIKELEGASRRLRREWKKTTNANDRKKLAADLKKVNTELRTLRAETRPAASGMAKLTASFSKLFGVAAGYIGFQVITETFRNLIQRGTELSDALSDVQKTTGLTDQEVRKLDKDLSKLNTRSSRKELLALAKEGGRLGIQGTADIRRFVEEADKINVALGEDLGDDAVLQIGKIASAFDTSMTKIASSINTLGQNTKAQEGYLVDFTARMQGTARTVGISASEIIGFGATLDSLGMKVEMSGTALNNFFIDFVKNTDEFGRAAGFAEGELQKIIGEEGANAGFIAFVQQLREANPESDKFLKKLEELGVNGARGAQVFLALSENLEDVKQNQSLANDAFEKGTSIMEEFNTRNNNFAADVKRVQRALRGVFMNSALMGGVEKFFGMISDYLEVPVSQKLQNETREMQSLAMRVKLAGDNQELRNKMVQQLIDKYPTYFGHLTAEKASLEDISKAMRQVNSDYRSRIKLALRQEELQEIEKKGFELTKKQEGALLILESKKRLASKHGARGYEDVKTARENLNKVTAELEENERKYLAVLEEVNQMQDAAKEKKAGSAFVGPPTFDYQEYFNQIDGAGEELSDKEKKRIAELASNTKAMVKQLQDAKLEAIDNVEQHAIASAKLEYERQKAEIEETAANEEVKNDLLEQLYKNFTHKKDVIHAEAAQKRIEHEQQLIEQANNSELLTLELRVDVAEDGSMEQLQAVSELLKKQMEVELASATYTNEQKFLIQQDYANRLEQLWNEYDETRRNAGELTTEEQIQNASDYIQAAQQITSEFASTIGQVFDMQLEQEQQAKEAQLTKIQDLYDEGVISQEEYNARRQQIEDRYAARERAIKREQFEIDRAARIAEAGMAMALAITTAMTAGPVVGQVLAGVTAVLAGLQIGMIAATPNPYYAGGYTDVTDTEGNRHKARNVGTFANGGYYDEPSYGVIGERGAELVIPNYVLTNPDYKDSIAHIEGAIARGYAAGGRTSSTATPSTSTSASSSNTQVSQANGEMLAALNRQNQFLQHLMSNGVVGRWEWEKFHSGILQQEKIDGKYYFSQNEGRTQGKQP